MIRISLIILSFFCCMTYVSTQELPPPPAEPKPIKLPRIRETRLKNGLLISVVEKKGSSLVNVGLVIKNGAAAETPEKAGLANMTAELLTKGTRTRSAEKVAEDIEFLGGSLNSSAFWNGIYVSMEVTDDKLNSAMPIFADVVLNPTFRPKEIEILRAQLQDNLAYNLKQPSFLANYVASSFVYSEHPQGGTLESLKNISRSDIVSFYKQNFSPRNAVLVIVGDITFQKATALANRFFGSWTSSAEEKMAQKSAAFKYSKDLKILIVDLPDSGQAAVLYAKKIGVSRSNKAELFSGLVANSVLGGGYSARLNQEIRIKRGLSYGAGSSFSWRVDSANFSARAQTKNESAAEVVELMLAEVTRLSTTEASEDEMKPRKAALVGNLARETETCAGLARRLAELYFLNASTDEIKNFTDSIDRVSKSDVMSFAAKYLRDGFFVVVGDYKKMKDAFTRRFPGIQINVISADEINLKKLLSLRQIAQ